MKVTFKHEIKTTDKISKQEIIDIILKNRQIKNVVEFLSPPHPSKIQITDFGFKRELKRTLRILEEIKAKNRMIVVYTDYDADGITGGAILWETLNLLGFRVMPYVPHRKLEGYGFSMKGIDAVKKEFDPALIISVDHGITAREKVKYAKKLGIPIIITDHHLKPEKLPDDAEAIFHIPVLSGSGVSYFFSKAVFEYFCSRKHSNFQLLTSHFICDYLALAAIGTIADLVALTGPSRSIVKYGLETFGNVKRYGIKHILAEGGITGKKITPYEVGFIIAPRINAVGRLEHAIDALRLLCTKNDQRAFELASKVGQHNRTRQDLVMTAVKEAKEMVKNLLELPKIIILQNDNWHEGIIGLIASKLTEEFYRPTIILTKSDGFLKGSARSIPALHITDLLRKHKKYLIDVGGHKGAAGFTIEVKKFTTFAAIVGKVVNKLLSDKDLERKLEADLKIPLSKITINLPK